MKDEELLGYLVEAKNDILKVEEKIKLLDLSDKEKEAISDYLFKLEEYFDEKVKNVLRRF